jgi:hypothetical protein
MRIPLITVLLLLFVGCASKSDEQKKKIIGKWVGHIKIPQTGKVIGLIYTEFKENGDLDQTTGTGEDQVTAKMTYTLSNDKIFYKSKKSNIEFASSYYFHGDTLILELDGDTCRYIRVK